MESLKQLIYEKHIDGVSIYFEIETNPNRFDFGKYTIEAKAIEFETIGVQEIPMNDLKDACNTVLQAETLADIDNKVINRAIAEAINYGKWSSVATEVANILNATLDFDEIQLIAQQCTKVLDGEDLLTTLSYYAEKYNNKVYEYENKSDLIRFVTQIFVCDWLQNLNGIRRCLGKQNFNKIYPTYDVIQNFSFRDAIEKGEECYNLTHKVVKE